MAAYCLLNYYTLGGELISNYEFLNFEEMEQFLSGAYCRLIELVSLENEKSLGFNQLVLHNANAADIMSDLAHTPIVIACNNYLNEGRRSQSQTVALRSYKSQWCWDT